MDRVSYETSASADSGASTTNTNTGENIILAHTWPLSRNEIDRTPLPVSDVRLSADRPGDIPPSLDADLNAQEENIVCELLLDLYQDASSDGMTTSPSANGDLADVLAVLNMSTEDLKEALAFSQLQGVQRSHIAVLYKELLTSAQRKRQTANRYEETAAALHMLLRDRAE